LSGLIDEGQKGALYRELEEEEMTLSITQPDQGQILPGDKVKVDFVPLTSIENLLRTGSVRSSEASRRKF
jgi:hypothetical protein